MALFPTQSAFVLADAVVVSEAQAVAKAVSKTKTVAVSVGMDHAVEMSVAKAMAKADDKRCNLHWPSYLSDSRFSLHYL